MEFSSLIFAIKIVQQERKTISNLISLK